MTLPPYSYSRGRYACLALGQLAAAPSNHEEILGAGGLKALSESLSCEDKETVFNACYALNKLASCEANHEVRGGCNAAFGIRGSGSRARRRRDGSPGASLGSTSERH